MALLCVPQQCCSQLVVAAGFPIILCVVKCTAAFFSCSVLVPYYCTVYIVNVVYIVPYELRITAHPSDSNCLMGLCMRCHDGRGDMDCFGYVNYSREKRLHNLNTACTAQGLKSFCAMALS